MYFKLGRIGSSKFCRELSAAPVSSPRPARQQTRPQLLPDLGMTRMRPFEKKNVAMASKDHCKNFLATHLFFHHSSILLLFVHASLFFLIFYLSFLQYTSVYQLFINSTKRSPMIHLVTFMSHVSGTLRYLTRLSCSCCWGAHMLSSDVIRTVSL